MSSAAKSKLFGGIAAGMAWIALLASPAPGQRAVTVWNCGMRQIKPASFTIACADDNDYLKSIRWTVWTGRMAKGIGIEEVNDCEPYCAAGKFHTYRVTITLDQVRSGHFTRIRLHYPGARPPYASKDAFRTLP